MARDVDWLVFEKAVEVTASAVRGAMGAEGSKEARFVGDVFREVWAALKEASQELPERTSRPGFGG
ncbi:MAG TPA: hypothetical protein VGB19_03415 [Actinomycetota bacterium]